MILASVLLESLGSTKLKIHYKGKISGKKFERLSLEQTILLLYAGGLINREIYSKMMRIREERNRLVHHLFPQNRLDYKKGETLIRIAIDCFSALGYQKTKEN
jgi:hypothetical protein